MSKLNELRAANEALDTEIKTLGDQIVALAESDAEDAAEQQETLEAEFDAKKAQYEKNTKAIKALEVSGGISEQQQTGGGRRSRPVAPAAGAGGGSGVEYQGEGVDRDPWMGFKHIGDFAASVMAADRKGGAVFDPRLMVGMENAEMRGEFYAAPAGPHREQVGEEGGYLAPPAMRMALWEAVMSDENNDILNMIDVKQVESNAFQVVRDETTPWGSTGIQAYWVAEGSQLTTSKLKMDDSIRRLHKLGVLAEVTEEEREDISVIEQKLTRDAGRAINYKASAAILYGDGTGKPLGFNAGGGKVTVAKESGQSADTIVAANVMKMRARRLVRPGHRWVALGNSDIYPQFGGMVIGDRPAYTDRIQDAGVSERIATLPYIETEHAKTLGDEGDLQFIDLSGYACATKVSGIKGAFSAHLYFDYDVGAFRWTYRIGGLPLLSAPVEPDNGSNTKSQYITLAARA